MPAEVGLRRIQKGMGTREFNRLDQEKQSFHDKVRAGYLNIARENPTRIVTIDGTQTPEEVVADCMQIIKARFFGN